jgi:hypothetical protein
MMKGTLVITDKKGKKIRSITFPATSDGSYRNVKWNGKDSKGKYVKPGTYTWTIKATDDPTRTGLKKGQAAKAIDGKPPPDDPNPQAGFGASTHAPAMRPAKGRLGPSNTAPTLHEEY